MFGGGVFSQGRLATCPAKAACWAAVRRTRACGAVILMGTILHLSFLASHPLVRACDVWQQVSRHHAKLSHPREISKAVLISIT
jgi:hypothetical protein